MLQFMAGGKRTNLEHVRKHVSQMNIDEIHYLRNKISSADNHRINYHAEPKIKAMGLTDEDIQTILNNYSIVEYNDHAGRPTVLIKGNKPYKTDRGDKVVINLAIGLVDGNIVTAFMNDINDKHKTANMSIYDKNLKIM